jgi:Na+/H+ antiporter NhaA
VADTSTGRTAWARNLAAPVRDFLSTETGGAAALLGATLLALAWANSPWWHSYESVWTTELAIRLGGAGVSHDLRTWINEGLMTFYFLVVGLEAKRELDQGQLRERRRLTIPVFASLGGMGAAVLIYLAFNAGGPGASGWGAAMSTDTAFALGLLALVAPGGTRLRVRLLTAAVVDDLVALIVIATAYTEHVSLMPLLVAAGLFAALFALRWVPGPWRLRVAACAGVAVWVALLKSGIDPVIAGLAVGLITSAYRPTRGDLEQVVERTRSFREQPTPELARSAQIALGSAISPNERLGYRLHPWTSFVIVPLFALANAGIHIDGSLLGAAITSPVTLGIFFGYVLGKPLGVVSSSFIAYRTARGRIRMGLTWPVVAGGGVVSGVGFTVSLLIASIAFEGRRLEEAKVGVLAAAVAASALAWVVFRIIRRLPESVRARQLRGTEEELVDLSDDVDPARDHIRGPKDAPVTLLEYGDYQCPYCGQAEVAIRELIESFGDDLRYVWRHLPLNDVHPDAQLAAEAAEAAAAQGEFWEYHDLLLAHQDELAPTQLAAFAEELGLDVDRFWEELQGREHAARVAEDVTTADASEVAGTPSFFIDGRRYQGAYDVETLTSVVAAAERRRRLTAAVAAPD